MSSGSTAEAFRAMVADSLQERKADLKARQAIDSYVADRFRWFSPDATAYESAAGGGSVASPLMTVATS